MKSVTTPKTEPPPLQQVRRAVLGGAPKKVALLLFSVLLLLTTGATTAHAQSALDGFDPNANFFVRVVATQPDGKILIGGEFTSFSPNGGAAVTRNRIARLNPNGTLDSGFNPNANEAVGVIVVQSDGKILIGGNFTTLSPNGGGPVTRNRIARLNPDGSLDTNFNPNANGVVSAIAVQADGKILAGGEFNGGNSIGGQTRNRMARLDATTGAADSFNPDASGFGIPVPSVDAIVVQADGMILVGGKFSSIGGQTRSHIARLNPITGTADSFNANASTSLGSSVQEIAVQADGKILVAGSFGNIGGQPRNCIARLDPVTGVADSWNPNANNTVYAMALQTDGKVLIGGDFNVVGGVTNFMARLDPITGAPEGEFIPRSNERVVSIAVQSDGKILVGGYFTFLGGGFDVTTRNRIARLEKNGTLDRTLNLDMEGSGVWATAIQPDGKILIAGGFYKIAGDQQRPVIARVNADGTLDSGFNPTPNGGIVCLAVQADGKILVGGNFYNISGHTRSNLARLNVNGTVDTLFSPNASGRVTAIAVQADGKILVGGEFASLGGSTIGGQPRNYIARLEPATGAADSFDPSPTGPVQSIAVQPDGKILVGGSFTNISGQTRNRIARLNTNGVADSFNPNANDVVHSIVVQPDGKILVGGLFNSSSETNSIGGQARNRIARLDAITGLADSFDPNADERVYSIAVQADGKIIAGGLFTTLRPNGGATATNRNQIARLNSDGSLDLGFDPDAGGGVVYSIALQADGKILVGGYFFFIGTQQRILFARLNNDTPALQNLAVTPTAVTWTRGGSSPQFARVTFEFSTNNVDYIFLGNGTSTGSSWTLTSLNLLAGQNIYIRARGVHSSGYRTSESIAESVRNVFFAPPLPRLNIQRSANTNVVLSWATNSTGFTLESKTNLNTNVWSVVTPAPVVNGTNNVVTNTVSGSARFYRLRQ